MQDAYIEPSDRVLDICTGCGFGWFSGDGHRLPDETIILEKANALEKQTP